MSFNFKNVAENATKNNQSFITENRVKVETGDLISAYPEGITVTGFDLLESKDGKFAAITFEENNELFYFGGSVLTSVVTKWAEGYEFDCKKGSEDLAASGGVKIRLHVEKSKTTNRNFVAVDVL